MMKLSPVVVAAVYLFATALGQYGDCPAECVCTDIPVWEFTTAKCFQLNSEMQFPEKVKHLVIDSVPDLKIKLTKNIFSNIGLSRITSIQISNCTISLIDYEAFNNLHELHEVELSDNGLILIHPDTFESNERLERLKLNGNPLQLTQLLKAEENYFLKSSSLTELDLSRCQMSEISWNLLSQTPKLRYINLSSNNIKVLDSRIFENVQSLDEIDLSNNMLMSLDDDLFDEIEELTVLNLQNNLFETIDDIDLPGLKELDVSHNNIKLLRQSTLAGLPDLSTINMSHNAITWVSEETFKDLSELKNLDLSYNALNGPLPKFLFENNELLETLYLGGNKEMHVFEGFATELPKLYSLDISNCGLHIVSNSSFSVMPALAILNMSYNSIQSLNHAMLTKIHRLNVLDLSHNNITKLGTYSFISNSHLRNLFLSHNHIRYLSEETFEATPLLSYLDLSYNNFTHEPFLKKREVLNKLEYLNIANNHIRNLDELSFHHLTNLKAIDFLGNPIECTAKFPTFIEWLYREKINPLHHNGRTFAEEITLERSNLQWFEYLSDICPETHMRTEEDLDENDVDDQQSLSNYITANEDSENIDDLYDDPSSSLLTRRNLQDILAKYIMPGLMIVIFILFLLLLIGNTITCLMVRYRNRIGFRRSAIIVAPTPRYHKLYEECSVPNPPIVKNKLLRNLVFSQIKDNNAKLDGVV